MYKIVRKLALIIVITVCICLGGCQKTHSLDDSTKSDSPLTSSSEMQHTASGFTLDIENEPVGFEENIAPDFLNEEQQKLYKRAYSLRSMLFIESLDINLYPDAKGQAKIEDNETTEINGIQYYTVSGRYSRWNEFYAIMTSIFTKEYFQQKWSERFIRKDDDGVFVRSASRGGDIERTEKPDSFELIEKTETSVTFSVIGYYKSDDGTEYEKSFTNEMQLTDLGWRITAFAITI